MSIHILRTKFYASSRLFLRSSHHFSSISVFDMMCRFSADQKAQYLHYVYFHNIDSPPYIFEISEHDVMTTLPWRTTLSFANARLVTLAPGLHPERRSQEIWSWKGNCQDKINLRKFRKLVKTFGITIPLFCIIFALRYLIIFDIFVVYLPKLNSFTLLTLGF